MCAGMQFWKICGSHIIHNIWSSTSHKKTEATAREVRTVPLIYTESACQYYKVLHDLLCPTKLMLRAGTACSRRWCVLHFLEKKTVVLSCPISSPRSVNLLWVLGTSFRNIWKDLWSLGWRHFERAKWWWLQGYYPCAPAARPFGWGVMICWGTPWKPELPRPALCLFSEVNRKSQTLVTSILNFSPGLNSIWREKSSRNDLYV